MTLFQKIIAREIPAEFLHEDEHCVVIRDIHPQAPFHALAIPRQPLARVAEAEPSQAALLGHLLLTAARVAREAGCSSSGFRLVINNGPDGGETVPHLHVHILAGRPMGWPPG
ncbi:MAG: histidine triad nucleotide-binding protein [Terrimicrobiaceae bacterium]|nr:histidine triad nucleotide-binding protein [Terrimicrobiaceae bacterium]